MVPLIIIFLAYLMCFTVYIMYADLYTYQYIEIYVHFICTLELHIFTCFPFYAVFLFVLTKAARLIPCHCTNVANKAGSELNSEGRLDEGIHGWMDG